MTIGKVTPITSSPAPAVSAEKTVTSNSKNIQNQISTKQQHLDRLNSDEKLNPAEKEKKRRELQKEIDELNRKLELARMRKEEVQKEAEAKQQKADAKQDELRAKDAKKDETARQLSAKSTEKATNEAVDKAKDTKPADDIKAIKEEKAKHVDMAIEDVQKMLTADYELQKDLTERHVNAQIERTVDVLESEIKQDERLGTDTAAKEAEIASIETKQNFWTEETQKQTTEKQKDVQQDTNKATGMHVQAKVNFDTI